MNAYDYFLSNSKKLDKDFILGPKEKISYKNLHQNCNNLAEYLRNTYGEKNNILLISPNSVFCVTVYLAIIKSGNICVPINPEIETDNLNFIINICKAKYIFITSNLQNKFDLKQYSLINENDADNIFKSSGKIAQSELNENLFDENRLAEIIFTS